MVLRHTILVEWVEFIVPWALYRLCESPMLFTWDRLFVIPPPGYQDRRWYVIQNSLLTRFCLILFSSSFIVFCACSTTVTLASMCRWKSITCWNKYMPLAKVVLVHTWMTAKVLKELRGRYYRLSLNERTYSTLSVGLQIHVCRLSHFSVVRPSISDLGFPPLPVKWRQNIDSKTGKSMCATMD